MGAPRLSRPGAALHPHRQYPAAGNGEAQLPIGRHGPALHCGVREASRREASRTRIQAIARREHLSNKKQ